MIKKYIPGYGCHPKACELHSLMQQPSFNLGKFYQSLSNSQKEALLKKRIIRAMSIIMAVVTYSKYCIFL